MALFSPLGDRFNKRLLLTALLAVAPALAFGGPISGEGEQAGGLSVPVEYHKLDNGLKVIVKINDRGPFKDDRIIDLSYGAAMQLDMIEDGTSLVEIRAIEFDTGGDRPVRTVVPAEPPDDAADRRTGNDIFVQVGAFGDRENAERRRAFLLQNDIGDVRIEPDASRTPTLYRVQIGPVADVFAYDRIVDKLATLGIDDPWLVTR